MAVHRRQRIDFRECRPGLRRGARLAAGETRAQVPSHRRPGYIDYGIHLRPMPSASPPTETSPTPCPSCSAPASGRFCANCGAPLAGALCPSCRAPLTPGARFCHRCGTPAGAGAESRTPATGDQGGFASALPWAVAGIALLALIALVAAQRFGRTPAPATDTDAQQAPAVADAPNATTPGVVRAPDISSMSPRERADRLYDRIMRLASEGQKDSATFFAQMGISAYMMLPQQDADSRYDMGRIAEVAGALPVAQAQADTILAQHPNHLLGLILAISTAGDAGDKPTVRRLQQRLLAAQSAELARNAPEYQRHQNEIVAAIEQAKKDVH